MYRIVIAYISYISAYTVLYWSVWFIGKWIASNNSSDRLKCNHEQTSGASLVARYVQNLSAFDQYSEYSIVVSFSRFSSRVDTHRKECFSMCPDIYLGKTCQFERRKDPTWQMKKTCTWSLRMAAFEEPDGLNLLVLLNGPRFVDSDLLYNTSTQKNS